MKFVYICEACGKEFDNFEECSNHEKACREEHGAGLTATEDIGRILAREGVIVVVDSAYIVKSCWYDATIKAVILDAETKITE